MPNDLEDFLKRAAALRQQKAAQQKASAAEEAARAARSQPPAYTDRNRERSTGLQQSGIEDPWDNDDEPIVMGEIMDVPYVPPAAQVPTPTPPVPMPIALEPVVASQELHNLMKMLQQPGGARQAFLMKEIFDRKHF